MKATKRIANLLTFWLIVVFVGLSPLTALASSVKNEITQDTTWSVVETEPYQYKWVSTSAGEVYVDNDMVSSTTVDEGATLITIVAPTQTSAPYCFQEISGDGSVHFISRGLGVGDSNNLYIYGTDGSSAEPQGGTAVSVSSLTAEDCRLNIEGGKGGDGGMDGDGGTGGTGVTGALTAGEGSIVTVTGGKGGSRGIGQPGAGGTGVTGEVTLAGGELTVKGGEPGDAYYAECGQAFGDGASVTIAEGFAYTDGQEVYPAGTYTKSTNPSIDAFAEKTLKLCEAKIENTNTFYATLQEAINKAEVGATITLVRDVEQKTTLDLSKTESLSLDLNGRKMLFNFNFNDASVRPFNNDKDHLITVEGSGTIEANGPNASGNAIIPLWRFVSDAAGTGTLTILDDAAMEGINNIGDRPWDAFKDSITAAVFDENVTKIGSVVLMYCNNLKTVTIPASVESIVTDSSGKSPFDDCPKLEKITVDAGNSTYSNYNDDGVLYTKDKTTLIYCPRGKTGTLTVPAEVTTLAKYAFNTFNDGSDCVMSLSRIEFAHTQACTLSTEKSFYNYTGDCVLVPAEGMLIDNQKQVQVSDCSMSREVTFRAVTPWDELQEALNKGGTVKLTRSYDYTKDSYEINGWGITSYYGKLIVPKGTALDLNGYTLAAVEFYGDGEFTVKGGTLNCTRLTNNATIGAPTNATYGTLTLDDATVTADQLLWFGGMALMESTLTVGESEEGAGNNGKIINVTWVQPESGEMLTMDTASSVTLPQQQETDGQWRLTDFQTSEDVAAAARQLGAYLPRGWTFETITGTRVYGTSEQPYYALAVKDTAGVYPTSVTLKLITDSVPATVTANNPTYDGKEKALVNVDKSTLVGGTMYYAVTTENTAPTDDNAYGESIPEATNAGTYYVWYKVIGDEVHYDSEAACVSVKIGRAAAAAATVTANNLIYDTTERALVIVDESTLVGGQMQYALGTDDQTAPSEGWDISIPGKTDAGTYYVWYRVVGDENHLDTEAAVVEARIITDFEAADLVMPADLTTIEESAFKGIKNITSVDAARVAFIGANVFRDCAKLMKIRLPKDCTIDATAFQGCGTVYVFAPAGGTTEAFCQRTDNSCVFVAEPVN